MQGFSFFQSLLSDSCNGAQLVCSTHAHYHCWCIGPYRIVCPAPSMHSACVVAVQRRLEKCCKYPQVRCRGEGFSAPPITSGCSQALFQTACFFGRAPRRTDPIPAWRLCFRFQLLPLETAVNRGASLLSEHIILLQSVCCFSEFLSRKPCWS